MSGKRAPTGTRGDAIFNSARGALTASTPESYDAPDPSAPPSHTLRVRRVAGYRIHDARHNLYFTGPTTAVFPAAAVGVVQDLRSPAQRFCTVHDDDVVALTYHKGAGLVATGQVGVAPAVHVWRANEPEQTVASFALPKGSKAVAAVAFSHDARYLVVAGADNDHTLCVFDVQSNKSEPVATTNGGSSAIVDLACAPSSAEDRVLRVFAGDDAQLLVWDVPSGTVRARAELPAGGARAVAIHPNTDLLAVGLSSGAVQHRRLSQPDQVVAPDVTVSSKRVTVLSFAPDGSKLAVGAADSNITILTNGQVTSTITAHSAAVTALDWSTDSTYIQSNSADYELLFTHVPQDGTATHDPDASNARSLVWATYSIPIGWATRGVWTPGQDGTDINAVARGGPGLVAIATDQGHVEVVNWPAPTAGHVTARHVGKVHAAHVTNVRWANGERTAVSTGGRDGCVVFWDVVPVA
ncbi:hypothetical protein AMAG_12561 [Allomyces macrogynus ATCC 38327]|uniref:EML-like second beta-propeller domain-containing protein n=1 Tax=Allomyces macrogynus (strain ATCC 38327) TaxID=578462 RepID=A0A0L0SZK6_ALLM3|nr:hypothetical protein AMAG_12561 [Allomyces macrogynus ATCC 38327]|eukprot:KNE67845.1 hypothetical protein AMAG_12561 [Allomyces macrogynus ATCC 38327]